MRYYLFLLLLLPLSSYPQAILKGKVIICKSCRGISLSKKSNNSENEVQIVQISKNKRGILKTDLMVAPYELLKDNEVITSGTTNTKGQFVIEGLSLGTYTMKISLTRLLKIDTVFQITSHRNNIEISINDRKFWRYYDSIEIAKFPFNSSIAKKDLSNGMVKILIAGLQVLPISKMDSLTTKYNFHYSQVANCILRPFERLAMEDYNNVVYNYLDQINENGWREKLHTEIIEISFNSRSRRSNSKKSKSNFKQSHE